MMDSKLAAVLKAFSEQISKLEADPGSVYLETQCEADGDYSCLQYKVGGVQVLRLAVKKDTSNRGEDVSFCLSDSPVLSCGSDTQSSVGVDTDIVSASKQIYSRYESPFKHKPDFQRKAGKVRSWKRTLSVDIPLDTPKMQSTTPAWEEIARYPRPSVGVWEQGTKRAHEDTYYYGDLEDY